MPNFARSMCMRHTTSTNLLLTSIFTSSNLAEAEVFYFKISNRVTECCPIYLKSSLPTGNTMVLTLIFWSSITLDPNSVRHTIVSNERWSDCINIEGAWILWTIAHPKPRLRSTSTSSSKRYIRLHLDANLIPNWRLVSESVSRKGDFDRRLLYVRCQCKYG